MYLKSIEVQGFKSFANKIVFDFNDGITGIVGPNGSGKSNVADAVRWVLGEQSAKQLRGSNMQDVIFAGTENRRAQGYAQVSITMDNADSVLPVDFAEVTVTRRVYRSGESEYLMNGGTCRLKDIYELFYDTGIGKEGYSIIGQGQIERILSGKPEERRELFDEAVGIVKFKKRKNIAIKKLENEKLNLLRVRDIVNELEKQIKPLERQSERAKEYLRLREELKEYDICAFLMDSQLLKDNLTKAEKNEQIAKEDIEEVRTANEALKASYEEAAERLSVLEAELEEKRSLRMQTEVTIENLEGQINVLNEQINNEKTSDEQAKERLLIIDMEIDEKDREIQELNDRQKEYQLKARELQAECSKRKKDNQDNETRIQSLEAAIDKAKADLLDLLNEKASIGAKEERYITMLEQVGARKQDISGRLDRMESDGKTIEGLIASLEADNKKAESEHLAAGIAVDSLVKKLAEARALAANAAQELETKNREYMRLKTRQESMKNLAERYEGFGISVRRLMEERKRFTGLHGVVADLIHVDKKYETAIETALGGSIQNIVTDTDATAKACIAYLKENRYGRSTFLPLNRLKPKHFHQEAVLKEKGVLGLAGELVTAGEAFRPLVRYLLGSIVVTDSIDSAMALAKKYESTLRIVTLDGELIQPGGAMTGGAYKNSSNLMSRSRELSELDAALSSMKEVRSKAETALEERKKERTAIEAALEAARAAVNESEVVLTERRMSLKSALERKDQALEGFDDLKNENRLIENQLKTIDENKGNLLISTQELEDKQRQLEEHVREHSAQLQTAKERREFLSKQLSETELVISGNNQQVSFISENLTRLFNEKQKTTEEKQSLTGSFNAHKALIEEKSHIINDIRTNIEFYKDKLAELDQNMSAMSTEKEGLNNAQKASLEKRDALNQRISTLDKELLRLEHQKERLTDQLEAGVNYLWAEYGMTPSEAAVKNPETGMSVSDVKKQAGSIKHQIKELGSINVNAIEEYKEVSERFFFMKGQQEDLEAAEANLVQIIQELDQGMRRQFEEKFLFIRREFDKVFKELFGGGQGSLELTGDEDILEAGIQIIAQPPGKKLQNMMQLSGGEKALTAISLLFAIQNLKPSPFCLLDEIEAALDDSNVVRFAQYLKRLKQNTQFIVITHRRGTMLAADRLYGITMQEKGVSTLVTVDLADAE